MAAAATQKAPTTAHKAPTETRPGPGFDIPSYGGRQQDDEIELLDNYEYNGATRVGFINDLPNFVGQQRYTSPEDFKFENLSFFSTSRPQDTDDKNIIVDFTRHTFTEDGNSDTFLQINIPFKSINVVYSFDSPTNQDDRVSTAGLGRYLVTQDSVEPKVTPSTKGTKNIVLDYSYGPANSNELQRLAFKNSSVAVSKDIISRIYEPPKPTRFSNYFSVTEEPSEQLIIQRKIEGQAFNGSNFEQTIVQSYTQSLVQDVESPPEGPTEVDVGSFTYSTPTTSTSTY